MRTNLAEKLLAEKWQEIEERTRRWMTRIWMIKGSVEKDTMNRELQRPGQHNQSDRPAMAPAG
jgi:hypothetical protein